MPPDRDPASAKKVPGNSGGAERTGIGTEDLDPGGPNKAGLARRFVLGQPAAIAATCDLIGKVSRFRGYFIPPDQRADVVQEALLDVFREAKDREFATDDEFQGFVRTVTYRRCIDWVRGTIRRSAIRSPAAGTVHPESTLLERERRDLAAKVVLRLRKSCRELFALRAGRGMSYTEISRLTGRSEGALRTQTSECLRQARQILRRMRSRLQVASSPGRE